MKMINSFFFFFLCVLFILPYFLCIIWGFSDFQKGIIDFFSLQGYKEFFEVSSRILSVGHISFRSTCISCVSTIVAYVFSYILIRKFDEKFRIVILGILTLPFLVSEATRVFMWNFILGGDGILSGILTNLSITDQLNISFMNSELTVWFVMLINTIPLSIFILFIVLSSIKISLWKASNDLGSNLSNDFFKIAIPNTKQGILLSLLLVFLITNTLSTEVQFLGGATKASIKLLVSDLISAEKISGVMFLGTMFVVFVSFLNLIIISLSKFIGVENEK